jgi:hypothetical protein
MKREIDYTLLRTFGCLCYPLLRLYANHKLSFRSKPCIFIGYGGNQKGYRCLDPITNKIFLSQSVIFDETQFPAKNKSISYGSYRVTAESEDPLVVLPLPHFSNLESQSTPPNSSTQPIVPLPQHNQHFDNTLVNSSNDPLPQQSPDVHLPTLHSQHTEATKSETSSNTSPNSSNTDHITSPSVIFELPSTRIITRSQTGNLKPKEFPGFKLYNTTRHPISAFQILSLPHEPSTYKQAASQPEWLHTMNLEYDALVSNQTWTLCPRPPHHNVVRNKWVFKLKQKPDGSVDRHKTRLVAKGFD